MLAIRLPTIPLRLSAILCAAMVLAAILAYWATPHLVEVTNAPSLEDTVPRQFGDWRELPTPYAQVSLFTGADPNMANPYDQTIMRTYVNSSGQQVMLALAWGKRQRQEVKIHRPDLCYVAQGFVVKRLDTVEFPGIKTPLGRSVIGKHMYAATARQHEAISYWVRIGDLYSEDAWSTRWHIFQQGLQGNIPDGILVRASVRTSTPPTNTQWELTDAFLTELIHALPPATRAMHVR
jgi:EpsI family protein